MKKVLVAAHRGDWTNFPENSIPGVMSCVQQGIDIVEIDVQETKDGRFILMHDATVNRTTNGRGSVSSMSFDDILKLKLKNKQGQLTEYYVPSLDTILQITKGNILVNIDKSAGRFDKLIKLIDSLDCGPNVILKGTAKGSYFKSMYLNDKTGTTFMPILSCSKKDIDSFLTICQVPLIEFLLNTDTTIYSRTEGLSIFRKHNCKIWYNALFSSISGGHNESGNAIDSWNWFIEHDAYIIQTDYPFHLMTYLVDKKLHPAFREFESKDLNKLPRNKVTQPKEVNLETNQKKYENEILIKSEKADSSQVKLSNSELVVTKKKNEIKTIEGKKEKKITKKFYEVKSGDTLSEIADKHHLKMEVLLKLNPQIKRNDIIRRGQQIRVR